MVSEAQREQGVRAIIASTRRLTPDRLDSRIKSLNYLNAILARMEANFAGVEEAVLLNDRGCVAEGTADNLFIVSDGVLLTPPATEGALAGITRQTVLELAAANGIPAREAVLTPYDLYNADECFLTGTGAKLIPVREIDGRKIAACPGEIYQQLAAAFAALIQRETEQSHD
jgi:branched-chain amino acid aminotransferase